MTKRKSKRAHFKQPERIAAVKETMNGASVASVAERLNIVPALLYQWRSKFKDQVSAAMKLNGHAKPEGEKVNGHARALTPEALFTSRVNRAIVTLRQAQAEVERMRAEGKIKGPDKAHLYAQLALMELQGDNAA